MRAIAGHGANVMRGAAQAGDQQEILVSADELGHRIAAIEHESGRGGCRQSLCVRRGHCHSSQNGLAPIRFCVSNTATACPLLNTMVSAAFMVLATSSGRSMRRQITPIASSTGCVAWPIG